MQLIGLFIAGSVAEIKRHYIGRLGEFEGADGGDGGVRGAVEVGSGEGERSCGCDRGVGGAEQGAVGEGAVVKQVFVALGGEERVGAPED